MLRNSIFTCFTLLVATVIYAQYPSVVDLNDRILKYHADITVQTNGDLNVKETITIYNGEFGSIERGILRDFPTLYEKENGFWEERAFTVKSVTRDEKKEAYDREKLKDGVRLKIGDKDVYLPNGTF